MAKSPKFVKANDAVLEKVFGRSHYWHYHPELADGTDTLMVKVVLPKAGFHNFHRHPEMNEILYILEGTAEQWIGDEMQILEKGDSVYIDPNVVHATFNVGSNDLEFLAILAPLKGWEAGTIDEYENKPYSEYRKKR